VLLGVADLGYEMLNMQVIETSIHETSGFSSYFFHTLIKQRLLLHDFKTSQSGTLLLIAQKFTILKGVFMQTEYDPHNYSYLQPEQPNTSKLNISNPIVSILPSKKECQNVEASVVLQNREQTRSKIANRLLTMLASSLLASFVLVGLSSLIPNSDKGFLKDLIPLVVTPQVGLLGVAIGFYFDRD
jgi:hypothetical protein